MSEKPELADDLPERFERLWGPGKTPVLLEFVRANRGLSLAGLAELIQIDQEQHLQRGKLVSCKDYFVRFPAILRDKRLTVEVIVHEYALRTERGEHLPAKEFARQFPEHAGELTSRLALAERLRETEFDPPDTPEGGPSLSPGSRFGRYSIVRLLGRGGMGEVYLVHDSKLDRQVAMKIPNVDRGDARNWAERFRREARLAAGLSHPLLCPVIDVGEHEGRCYLTMPFVQGETLADTLRREGALAPARAAELTARIARAVQAAHDLGVVHRDLKPSNVMRRPPDEPVVMDFGLARRSGGADPTLTDSGAVLGTVAYLAPECVRGEVAGSVKADVYSLGVILFELLTGVLPFQGTGQEIVAQRLTKAAPAPVQRNRSVPAWLNAACVRAMHADPARRFPTMDAFADALERGLAKRAAGDAKPALLPRRAMLLASLATLVVALIVGGVLLGPALFKKSEGAPPKPAPMTKQPTTDRPTKDLFTPGSRWLGSFRFVTDPPSNPVDAQIFVTHRDGENFKATYQTEFGKHVFALEGTIAQDGTFESKITRIQQGGGPEALRATIKGQIGQDRITAVYRDFQISADMTLEREP
jgi:serine/threonine protein kinase